MSNQNETPQERVENFYEWLKKMGNIHLADTHRMNEAFSKVTENV